MGEPEEIMEDVKEKIGEDLKDLEGLIEYKESSKRMNANPEEIEEKEKEKGFGGTEDAEGREEEEKFYERGEEVYFYDIDKKEWVGPVKVVAHDNKVIFVRHGPFTRKVPSCRVMPTGEPTETFDANKEEDREDQRDQQFTRTGNDPETQSDDQEEQREPQVTRTESIQVVSK